MFLGQSGVLNREPWRVALCLELLPHGRSTLGRTLYVPVFLSHSMLTSVELGRDLWVIYDIFNEVVTCM